MTFFFEMTGFCFLKSLLLLSQYAVQCLAAENESPCRFVDWL